MRVLMVLPSISSASGGPVRSTVATCRAVGSADPAVRFTLATTDAGLRPGWRDQVEAELPPNTEVRVFSAAGRNAFAISPGLLIWLCRRIRDHDLAILQALFNPVSSSAALIAGRQGVPYVVLPHGTLSRYTFTYRRTLLKRTYFRMVERRTLAGAAVVRFTNAVERDEAPAWGTPTPTAVIPHPYEPRFPVGAPREERPGRILFLSRWHPVKGLPVLLDAFRLLVRQKPGARLILAGSGSPSYERRIRGTIARLGLDEAVSFPGFVEGEAKAELLQTSAVFVLPSLHENLGISAVEAMDAGLPVVLSRGVGIGPEVQAAGAGVVLAERTPLALAGALARLLGDSELRRDMGRRGQELARAAFDPERIGIQLLHLYHAAARRPSGVPAT